MAADKGDTQLAKLAEQLLGALRSAAKVQAKDPNAVIAAVRAFPQLEMASPPLTAKFVHAAAGSKVGALASVSPSLAALSMVSAEAAALAIKYPDLARLAVLSPEVAALASKAPELRAIAAESPGHAILAARLIGGARK